ncbi:hypothetical protein EC973_004293 [Apophysomyces ossiformis]|uniref:PB1 domain-containing protein n=1 Tax=Apophysomyces ossiformis TaxID=679940 RepID=A0A8H7ELJ8_9FUNG|nr:hypothetical protein EC973_004293 [Apophysomyces ossiformis]
MSTSSAGTIEITSDLHVKAYLKDRSEFRRFWFKRGFGGERNYISYDMFVDKIKRIFSLNTEFSITYTDYEGDEVRISSDEELGLAITDPASPSSLRIVILGNLSKPDAKPAAFGAKNTEASLTNGTPQQAERGDTDPSPTSLSEIVGRLDKEIIKLQQTTQESISSLSRTLTETASRAAAEAMNHVFRSSRHVVPLKTNPSDLKPSIKCNGCLQLIKG